MGGQTEIIADDALLVLADVETTPQIEQLVLGLVPRGA